ncbi:MAG: hypothetical protein ACYTF0_07850, partial [Planctomycetota bacterium]
MRIDPVTRRIEYHSRGVLLAFQTVFGGVFAAFGGWGVYALLTGGEMTVNGRPGTPADAWLPGIFLAIGLGIALFRYRKIIDIGERTVRTRWGWLLPCFGGLKGFAPVQAVELSKEIRRGDKSSYTVYPIRLLVESGEPVTIYEPRSPQRGRADAEAVAKLCAVVMRDITADDAAVVERA